MRFILLSFFGVLFCTSPFQGASVDSMGTSAADLLAQVSAALEARPYGTILDGMQSKGGLLSQEYDTESASRKAAMDHAFWAHYTDLKLKQSQLSASHAPPLFTNVLSLIRDPLAPSIDRADLISLDDLDEMLDICVVKFNISCNLLLYQPPDLGKDSSTTIADVLLTSQTDEATQCMDWFAKVLASKDAQTSESNGILVGRLLHLTNFLNEAAISDNVEHRAKARHMVEEHLIANAGECPDRAISGLDDMDLGIALFHTPTLEQAIHHLLRSYKKQIIRESIVEHEYAESAQEYVYLLLLLNQHFNLGVCSSDIWSGQCGARKPFDMAAKMLMENLSVDGLCHYLATHAFLRSFIHSQPEHQEAMDTAASDPDTAEDAIYTYMQSLLTPYIQTNYAIAGDKFQELTPEHIEVLKAFVNRQAAD